ncbi:hypothetical protein LTR85_007425 [Meristemomyces frigidus]|nr:hypothetical protein LTR85_007425 [Meristemomyces frigidus]
MNVYSTGMVDPDRYQRNIDDLHFSAFGPCYMLIALFAYFTNSLYLEQGTQGGKTAEDDAKQQISENTGQNEHTIKEQRRKVSMLQASLAHEEGVLAFLEAGVDVKTTGSDNGPKAALPDGNSSAPADLPQPLSHSMAAAPVRSTPGSNPMGGEPQFTTDHPETGEGDEDPDVDTADQSESERESRDESRPYSTVVRMTNDRWLALRCPFGGGNASEGTKTFFAGLPGLRMHMLLVHGEVPGAQVPKNDALKFFRNYPAGGDELTRSEAIQIRLRTPQARISPFKLDGSRSSNREPERRRSVFDEADDSLQSKHEPAHPDGHVGPGRSPSPPAVLRKQRADSVVSKSPIDETEPTSFGIMLATKVMAGVEGTRARCHARNERSTMNIGSLPVRNKVPAEAHSGKESGIRPSHSEARS